MKLALAEAGAGAKAKAGVALAIALLVLAVAWAGRASEGRRAIADAEAATDRGDTFDAILAARAAAEARCPLCSAPDEGYAKLEKIARDAEARGDDISAFAAWRAVRAATLGTAGWSTTSERRERAEKEIARFGHRIDAAAVATGANATAAAEEEKLRTVLATRDVPSGATFGLVAVGAVIFAYAAWRFVRDRAARYPDLFVAGAGAALAVAGAALF